MAQTPSHAVYRPPTGDNLLVESDRNPGHRISLQGAWEPPEAAAHDWIRPFGRPVDLPAGESVELVVVAPRPILESVRLNGRSVSWRSLALEAAGMFRGRAEVTADLAARNELRLRADAWPVDVDGARCRRGPLPESVAKVWLEIHGASSLDRPGSADHLGSPA